MPPDAPDTMTLLERIESTMRDAMRARDERRTQTMRMAMAAAHNRRIELGRTLTDAELLEVLSRQVKQRRESSEMFRAGGREDAAIKEEAEIEILAEFLPQQLTDAEIESMARDAIAETGASGPRDMGRVMGVLAPRTKARADGRAVSQAVQRLLADRDSG